MPAERKQDPGNRSPSGRQVRVFISSTFRDMHAERDHLVIELSPPSPLGGERAGVRGESVSHRVLSLLSKHSTRDPSGCRDEIANVGKVGRVTPCAPLSDKRISPLACGAHGVTRPTWRFQQSDESRRFAGEIESLNGHFKPIKSEARICQWVARATRPPRSATRRPKGDGLWQQNPRRDWSGAFGPFRPASRRTAQAGRLCYPNPRRTWLLKAIDQRCNAVDRTSRLFWIMGAPGIGKSASAAQLHRKDAAELFDYLLANPLHPVINGGRKRSLIVIDALDEAGEAGCNPLVEMLTRNAQRLPDWLGLIVIGRPEIDVEIPLPALIPYSIALGLDLETTR